MASLSSTTETAPVVGATANTLFDPAFIAGLKNTYDGANAQLEIVQNLPRIRLVDEGDSTDLVVTCNKGADLTFAWEVSNVRNFPSTDTTTVSAGNVDGLDVVAITSVVAYMSKYFRCKVTFTTPTPNEVKSSSACFLEINTGGDTESGDDIIIGVHPKKGHGN